jgi:hypothetical protein
MNPADGAPRRASKPTKFTKRGFLGEFFVGLVNFESLRDVLRG